MNLVEISVHCVYRAFGTSSPGKGSDRKEYPASRYPSSVISLKILRIRSRSRKLARVGYRIGFVACLNCSRALVSFTDVRSGSSTDHEFRWILDRVETRVSSSTIAHAVTDFVCVPDGSILMDELAALEFADTKSYEPAPIAIRPHIPRASRGQHIQNYMCGECGKGYKWMANLRRHQRLECGKLPKYHCRMCRKEFYRRYELTNHFNTKHSVSGSLYGYGDLGQKDPSTTWPV
ncbi:uncharacterized protein LOC143149411 [Ptiloglossa arizonensis]|uniref:uncharacterized protein LOC143149411 n=1 Tax=Ptiloglossa arizonensis TaxID=3350558 RepID=UPI003FA0D41A